MNLFGAEVRVSSFLPPGVAVLNHRDRTFYVRHMSECFLMLSGATWHVDEARCPTWTDATECRCMLGDEA